MKKAHVGARHNLSRGFASLIFAVVLVTLLCLPFRASLQNKPAPKIDLNGSWMDGKRQVKITQIGSSVVAKYVEPPPCDPRDGSKPKPRETDFVGTISGNSIEGDATVCNYGEKWGSKIGIQSVKMVLAISADQNTLHGSYDGWKGQVAMTLERKCAPDEGDLCFAVGRAIQAMKGAISAPASAAHYQNLQRDVGTELSQMKSNLCDDPEKSAQVDALQRELDSLNYVPGQSNTQNSLALVRIEKQVKQFGVDFCGRSSPDIPPPPSCPQGNEAKTETDTAMFNSFREPLERNLTTALSGPGTILRQKQTRTCLGEMFGQWCAPNGFIKNLRTAMTAWAEGLPSAEVCKNACQSLGAWYISSECSKGGLAEAQVVDKCILTSTLR